MTGRLVFLLEEPSMKELLEGILPRFFPGLVFQCVAHEGKSDLDKSIPRKLRAWKEPGVRFVVVRDNDNAVCTKVKDELAKKCRDAGREDTLVRLVCQELESWYIGDLPALTSAYPGLIADNESNRFRYMNPDKWQKPSAELEQVIPTFQKIDGARRMSKYLSAIANQSHSFKVFLAGVRRIAKEMGYNENEVLLGQCP